jgi:hypothetical protein
MKNNSFKLFSTRSDRISYKRDKRQYIDIKTPINIIKNFKKSVLNRFYNKTSDGKEI